MRRLILLIVGLVVGLVTSASAQPTGFPDWNSFTPYPFGSVARWDSTPFVCTCYPNGSCNPNGCLIGVNPGVAVFPYAWIALSGAQQWRAGSSSFAGQAVMRGGSLYYAVRDGVTADPLVDTTLGWIAGILPPTIINVSGTTGVDIQRYIDAAPAGGLVQLGCLTYTLSAPLIITKPLTLQGCGRRNSTTLSTPADASDVIQVNTTGAVVFRNFSMDSPGKTGGSFIHWMTSDGGFSVVDNMTFAGHLVALDMEAATIWSVTNSYFVGQNNPNTKDIYVHSTVADNGGFLIGQNVFDNGGVNGTAIFLTSGGGTRIVNNAFLNHAADLVISWSGAFSSSEIVIAGNAFDAQQPGDHPFGIVLSSDVATSLYLITITDNSFANHTVAEITTGGTNPNNINGVMISGNVFSIPNGSIGVNSAASNLVVSGNQFSANGTATGVIITGVADANLVTNNQFSLSGTWSAKVSNASATSKAGVFSVSCENGIIVSGTGC